MPVLKYRDAGGNYLPLIGPTQEVYVGTNDPGVNAGYDLWYDTDAPDPGYGQGVMRFANVAARDAGVPAPVAGMMCYLADTGTLQMHNGFVWVGDTARAAITLGTGWTASTPSPSVKMDFRGHCTVDGRCSAGASATALIGNVPARYAPNPSSAFRATTATLGTTITAANISISGGATALNVTISGTITQIAGMTISMEYDVDFLSVR